MRQRKIDDNQLLQLLREGKNQKQIASALGVSNVAVHKRLKKLLPVPKSLENLTPKEQKFCQLVAQGKSRTNAVMDVYDVSSRESAKVLQNTLMRKDDIKIAISELMEIYGLTRGYRIYKLKSHIDHPDPMASLKALDLSWKLDGSYSPEKHMTMSVNYQDLLREEKEILDALQDWEERKAKGEIQED